MKLLILAFVCLLSLVNGQQNQLHEVIVDDPWSDNMINRFICNTVVPSSGTYAPVKFGGGIHANIDWQHLPKVFVFPDGLTSSIIGMGTSFYKSYHQPGTHWVYVRDQASGQNLDYVQIEVVTLGTYTGDCFELRSRDGDGNPAYDNGPVPPEGWDTMPTETEPAPLPPAYTPSSN